MAMLRIEFGRLLVSVNSLQASMFSREFRAAGGDRAALEILRNNGWVFKAIPARPNPGEVDLPPDWKDVIVVISQPTPHSLSFLSSHDRRNSKMNILDLRHATTEDLDNCMIKNVGLVDQVKLAGNTCLEYWGNFIPNLLPGGWGVRWAGVKTKSAELVLVPSTGRARRVRKLGFVQHWTKKGLNSAEAEALYECRTQYKIEVADKAIEIWIRPEDEKLSKTYRSLCTHPGSYGSGSGRSGWRMKNLEALKGADLHEWSAQRELALVICIRALQEANSN